MSSHSSYEVTSGGHEMVTGGLNPMTDAPMPIIIWIHFGISCVILVLAIINVFRKKESFSRGIYHPEGMIKADHEEGSPAAARIGRRWTKNGNTALGHPIWGQKSASTTTSETSA